MGSVANGVVHHAHCPGRTCLIVTDVLCFVEESQSESITWTTSSSSGLIFDGLTHRLSLLHVI